MSPAAPTTLPTAHIQGLRVIAHGLTRLREDAAAHMLATQAQLYDSGVRGLQIRSTIPIAEEIAAGRIVRTWSQRGTHHLLAAEDATWMMRLCAPRARAGAEKRQTAIGLTPEDVHAAHDALRTRLTDGPLTRTGFSALLQDLGIDPGGHRSSHLLRHFGSYGDIVQAPRMPAREGAATLDDAFMLVSDLPVAQRDLHTDEAAAEMARRYLLSHGPATVQDIGWWSGLTLASVRAGLALLGDDVVEVREADGSARMLMHRDAAELLESDDWPALLEEALGAQVDLPAFDEFLIGYKDRARFVPARLAGSVGPGINGMCYPFTIRGGMVVNGAGPAKAAARKR